MVPRPRKRGSKDLPDNLYTQKKGNVIYYRYLHPVTKEFIGVGKDKREAVAAARQANQLLIQKPDLLGKVITPEDSFADYLEYFRDEIIPNKRVNGHPLSPRTVDEYRRVIKTLIGELGHHGVASIRQKDIADYLASRSSAEVYNKHRTLLVMIFRQAVSDEKVAANLAEKIVKRDGELTKRLPLSLEMYQQIYEHARPAIRNAMELSLNALQRRTDIQAWRFDSKVTENGSDYYQVIVSKTKKHGKNSFIEIPAKLPVAHSAAGAKTMDDLVRNCRDGLVCPFLVHEQPERRRESKEKQHMMQLSLKQISDGFSEARELAGIKMENPPTFHELLALGEKLRQDQGWTTKHIQKLRGHSKEKTTQDYLDRQVQWTRIEIPGGSF